MLIDIVAPISPPQIGCRQLHQRNTTWRRRRRAEEFLAARKEPIFGAFSVLVRGRELMNAYRTFGDYLRFKASVGNKLTEFIILVTAREWTQDFEWNFHVPLARKEGIGQEIIDAIADGRRPSGMSEDVEICHNLVTELQRCKRVSDATYARAVERFGEKACSTSSESPVTTRRLSW
jgi:4-carboxymuconolactone decarboxylase